ncbi:MAG: PhzF family phenazine biosynthesis protein [Vulcanimicrobiaceae bacterium]
MRLKFQQIDVFTTERFSGNPLAVFWDADELSDTATMQRIAREMNLSETTFVRKAQNAGCAFEVRIFTPGAELPFAGHPTLGTAFVLDNLGLLPGPEFAFEEGVGPVRLRKDGNGRFWMFPPAPTVLGSADDASSIERALSIPAGGLAAHPRMVDGGGSVFLCIILNDPCAVDSIVVDRAKLAASTTAEIGGGFLLIFSYRDGKAYSRMFASEQTGIGEDPATGGSVASVCYALHAAGKLRSPVREIAIEQGVKMGRRSVLHAQFDWRNEELHTLSVGGDSVFVFQSELEL